MYTKGGSELDCMDSSFLVMSDWSLIFSEAAISISLFAE